MLAHARREAPGRDRPKALPHPLPLSLDEGEGFVLRLSPKGRAPNSHALSEARSEGVSGSMRQLALEQGGSVPGISAHHEAQPQP